MSQTVVIADRRNIALTFQVGDKDTSSPAALRAMHAARAIDVIDEVPFVSRQQKRDISYNNAAHFLRLSKEVIARHHLF
jgi:hypothetical protein